MTFQADLFETAQTRSQLDQLLQDSRLFRTSAAFKELLDFVVRLREFAPFNAMLLQLQKPGLRYAASRTDWQKRFDRTVKDEARPLLIMWPFGPVSLVYDLMDTVGPELPENVFAFPATGNMTDLNIATFVQRIAKSNITTDYFDAGDNKAGHIVRMSSGNTNDKIKYKIGLNINHAPNTRFASLAHELGHLCLGHLGSDKALKTPDRLGINHAQREIEAEALAYLVCSRHGVACGSQSYLASYVQKNTDIDQIDLYQIMRAAGAVEVMLGLNHHHAK